MQKKRKDPFQVTIDLAGYQQVVTQVISGVKGARAAGMAGNVIFGGLIGVGVDAATGATKDLIPDPLVVKLVPAGMANAIPATATPATATPAAPSQNASPARH